MKSITVPLKRKQIKALAPLKQVLDANPGATSVGQVLFRTDGSAVLRIGCVTQSAAAVIQALSLQDKFTIDLDK